MGLIEHAKQELKVSGYNVDKELDTIETEKDYADSVGKAALELVEVFAKQGHSGFSANMTLQVFNRLANYRNLSPLTANPDEWTLVTDENDPNKTYQSKRCSSCFTEDFVTYYDIDDPDNNIYEKDENGELTGYAQLKPVQERKRESLVPYETVSEKA